MTVCEPRVPLWAETSEVQGFVPTLRARPGPDPESPAHCQASGSGALRLCSVGCVGGAGALPSLVLRLRFGRMLRCSGRENGAGWPVGTPGPVSERADLLPPRALACPPLAFRVAPPQRLPLCSVHLAFVD